MICGMRNSHCAWHSNWKHGMITQHVGFPPTKSCSFTRPSICMSEISILWFNVRETVVMKVLLWLMAGSAVFFRGTLWIVFKCISIKCSDVVGCGEEAEHGDGGRRFFHPKTDCREVTLGFAKPAINYGNTNTQTQTQWWWRLKHICIPSTKFVRVESSNSGTCNVCEVHISHFWICMQ